jgi:NAD(P)-dependent dehydrogenase (short-subunit alcohol dehydrogenase family)
VLPADITDRAAIEAAIAQAAQCLGGIDVLVPCAAGLAYGGFADLRPEDFDRSHDVTFRGAVNTIRAGLPELERSGGTLVAVVSMASKIGVPPSGIARRRLHRAPGVHRDALLRHATSAVGTKPKAAGPRVPRRGRRGGGSPSAHGIPARRSTSGAAPRRRACSRWCPGP